MKRELLEKILVEEIGEDDLRKKVVSDIVQHGADDYADSEKMRDLVEGVYRYSDDILSHGCISGMVTSLIYYNQTNTFFEKYKEEILEILEDIDYFTYTKDTLKDFFMFPESVKNNMAWAAYEEVNYQIHEALYQKFYDIVA